MPANLLPRSLQRVLSTPTHQQLLGRGFQTSTRVLKAPTIYYAEKTSNFLETFIKDCKVPEKTLSHFRSTDWTRRILEDETYEIVPFYSRYLNDTTGENRFFSATINTETGMPHFVSLRKRDWKNIEPLDEKVDDPFAAPASNVSHEVLALASFGRDLDAHASIVHGGVQCVMFDEIIRFLILLHHNATCKPGSRDSHYTVKMDVSWHAPMKTPGTVLMKARLLRREGRKWFTEAEIVDNEGTLLTKATAMWITARK